jgi:hypothetical protein
MTDMVKRLSEKRKKRELKKKADSVQLCKKRELLKISKQDLETEKKGAAKAAEAGSEEHDVEDELEPPILVCSYHGKVHFLVRTVN